MAASLENDPRPAVIRIIVVVPDLGIGEGVGGPPPMAVETTAGLARLGDPVELLRAQSPHEIRSMVADPSIDLVLLDRLDIDDPSDVLDVRYRGNGWPGRTVFTVKTGTGTETRSLSYEESWGEILTNHKQWRCNVCADHTGEFADIAVGDPWHRRRDPQEPGRSLILVRTERGRRILADAVAAGYVAVERSDHASLPASQPELLRGRGAVWGRLLACRLMGVPAPRYRGMPMFRHWWSRLSLREKTRATVGTVRRVHRRRLRTRTTVT